MRTLKHFAAQIIRSPLASNVAAFAAAELVGKVSRLGTVLAMARTMEPAQIGVAAGALAIGEIMKSLTENGIGHVLIAADEHTIEAKARTAHRLVWGWCIGLLLVQGAIAVTVYAFMDDWVVAALIALLGLEYLWMPGGLVSCALAMREGKLRQTAAIAGAQNVFANVATAAFVIAWPSAFAVILGKLVAAPVWLFAMRRLRPYTPANVTPASARSFIDFGRSVIGIKIVDALRAQADKLIIGGVLGADALGTYYFAINAGLGLATSFSSALATVLYPYLCASADRDGDVRRAGAMSLALIVPIVLIQALMAPIYVPLVFGSQWNDVAPLVSMLCLVAIPAVLWSAASQWLRARGEVGAEFRRALAIAVAINGATLIAAPHGLSAVALAVLLAATASQTIASWPVLRLSLFPVRAAFAR